MFGSFLNKTRVSILKRISSVVSMLCLLGMSVKTVNLPWQINVLLFLYASGLLLAVFINKWETSDFDPNVVVFLVKVVFLL